MRINSLVGRIFPNAETSPQLNPLLYLNHLLRSNHLKSLTKIIPL